MAKYVDGFVLPMPTKNVAAYRRIAKKASAVFREHGALEYCECVGDDLNAPFALPFTTGIGTRRGETVVFAWIVYASKAQRDRVNAKAMADPRMAAMMKGKKMPFDIKRMLYGGFKVIVEA